MRRYETIVIIDPDVGKDARATLFDEVRDRIDQFNGRLIKLDEWGNRQLAYAIKKKPRGHYVRLDYCGTVELVDEMERRFKINDAFLKFMTVLLEGQVDMAAIEAEIAETAEQEKKAAEAREKAAAAAEKAASEEAESKEADSEKAGDAEADDTSSKSDKSQSPEDSSESETPVSDVKETTETSVDDPESNEKE